MLKKLRLINLIGVFLLLSIAVSAQPVNEKAREWVALGKKFYSAKKYEEAAKYFEKACEEPQNRLSTASLYYAGLTHFQLRDWENANKRFDQLISTYPRSTYIDDALFHLNLTMMEGSNRETKERGLNSMFEYLEKFESQELRDDARSTTKYYLFHKYDLNFLNGYYLFAPETAKEMVMEAIIFQLMEEGDRDLVEEKLQMYEAEGRKPSEYMRRVRMAYAGRAPFNTEHIRVAIFLPLNLQFVDTASVVPAPTRLGLELFEGMKMAMDSIAKSENKSIVAKVFDTQGDPMLVEQQVAVLDTFLPNFIVGDVRNKVTRPIAEWAEASGVVHMVPLSPSKSLIENKQNIFLAHPSVERHAEAIAEFAVNERNHKRFIVFTDNTKYPKLMTDAFTARLEAIGGEVVKEFVIPTGMSKEEVKRIATYVNQMKGYSFDAIYVPLSSEEHAGLIISRMNWVPIRSFCYGSPDWENFSAIDPELMENFQVTISTPYYQENDTLTSGGFKLSYYDQFFSPHPSNEVVEGFDIMHYLLSSVDEHDPADPFSNTLRQRDTVKTMHQDYFYNNRQGNQAVNIITLHENHWIKVNNGNAYPWLEENQR